MLVIPVTKEEKILVCIPSYNAEESISATINSVLNQSIKNYGILVVDNCSTDKTAEIVEKMRRADDNSEKIKFEANPTNLGRIPNWNKCIELFLLSDFDYLKFLFTGDTLQKDCLETLLNGFKRYNDKLGIVAAGYNNTEGGITKKIKRFNEERHLTSKEGLTLFVEDGNWVGAPLSCMFSKDAVRDLRFDKSFDFTSDWIFYIHVVCRFDALCINKIVGNFSALQRKHFQKYRSNLFAKLEELHTRYFALEKLKAYISEAETNQLVKYLNKESVKALILHISLADSFSIFIYKLKKSVFNPRFGFKKTK